MSATPTLNSRLRVLVAKAFKAEKLYASIRSPQPETSLPTSLGEMANDVRAKEWQRAHFQLRTALNDILSETSGAQLAAGVHMLRERFIEKANEGARFVDQGRVELADVAKRSEFAHGMKLCMELVRHNARSQAYSVLIEELSAILEGAGRMNDKQPISAKTVAKPPGVRPAANSSLEHDEQLLVKEPLVNSAVKNHAVNTPSNVVPFRRRVGVGGRSR
jgi:hypothetical protein